MDGFGILIILCNKNDQAPCEFASPIELDHASSAKIVMKIVSSAPFTPVFGVSLDFICRNVDSESIRNYGLL
jgi:hypothetical protein